MMPTAAHAHRSAPRFITVILWTILMLIAVPFAAQAASETTVPVHTQSDITDALDAALPGDTVHLVLQESIELGADGTNVITIPAGVTATITNKAGVDVTVTRNSFLWNSNLSRFNINGTLTITENGSGSLVFDGEDVDFGPDPIFAADGGTLTINSGTVKRNASYYGAIYSCDGANTTFNGGLYDGNKNIGIDGTKQGGLIYAANSNLTINSGRFTNNVSLVSGGVVYYEGRTEDYRLIVNGGVFDGNRAEGMNGGAITVDCQNEDGKFSKAEFYGGEFYNNTSKGFGGAVYIQLRAEVKMLNIVVTGNTATARGGGIWNCPTGGESGYNFNGMYIAENTAEAVDPTTQAAGDDIYSETKQVSDTVVNISDYAMDGQRYNWTKDETGARRQGIVPDGSYYQLATGECALKSGLSAANAPAGRIIFQNNSGLSGGAIANNGQLTIGEPTYVSAQKLTTEATADRFGFVLTISRGGVPLTGNFICYSTTQPAQSIAFDANGKAAVSLEAGEIKTFVDIPLGASFAFTENTADGWTLKSAVSPSGIIKLQTGTSVFTNVPSDQSGSLTVTKTVSGSNASAAQAFSFRVKLSDSSINDTFGDMTFTSGVATFSLKHGETASATGLPIGVTFTVTEDAADYTPAITVDGKPADAATGRISAASTVAVAFDNHRDSPTPPRTGDSTPVLPLMLLMLGAVIGMMILHGLRKPEQV